MFSNLSLHLPGFFLVLKYSLLKSNLEREGAGGKRSLMSGRRDAQTIEALVSELLLMR